ncbi:hypothetical protein F1D05_26170 [Kribbella qitaiheensis]|uniref:VWA domain-containing protein n=1 Tax=Kribbella qitaiheensis TaxID=1544730 RepID=A0A7G6X3E5_9ACTN|nr:hypothetical protein [Kribbella qitaiheensis]QNE20760.1 hypothetical protein F1D05_26170 [Kribbella qitaiheensis]
MRQAIEADRDKLKADGLKVFRPCVFFLTDGEPNDGDWNQVFKDTLTYDAATGTGMRSYPIFVPFGFRQAQEEVMKKLAYPRDRGKWFLATRTDPESAVRGILDLVRRTVMVSSQQVGTGKAANGIADPEPGSGIVSGESEYI